VNTPLPWVVLLDGAAIPGFLSPYYCTPSKSNVLSARQASRRAGGKREFWGRLLCRREGSGEDDLRRLPMVTACAPYARNHGTVTTASPVRYEMKGRVFIWKRGNSFPKRHFLSLGTTLKTASRPNHIFTSAPGEPPADGEILRGR
jgi:hypothetical protein